MRLSSYPRCLSSRAILTVAAGIMVSSCARGRPAEAPSLEAAPTPPRPNSSRTIVTPDERMAALADEVPGFGGAFRDPQTRGLVAYSAIPENDEAVREATRRHFGADPGREVVILRGEYSYRDLLTWKHELAGAGSNLWYSNHIAESDNQVRFQTSTPERRDRLIEIARERGIPSGAVQISGGSAPPFFGRVAELGPGFETEANWVVFIKERDREDRCGIHFLVTDSTRIEVRSGADEWTPADRTELRIGREVWVSIDGVVLTSCPGRARTWRLQLP